MNWPAAVIIAFMMFLASFSWALSWKNVRMAEIKAATAACGPGTAGAAP